MRRAIFIGGLVLAGASSAMAAGTRVITAATVGVSSAQALASSAGPRMVLSIDNEHATAVIACAFGTTAVLHSAGSYTITAGGTRVWMGTKDNPINGAAINCISDTGNTPVTIESAP